MNDQYLKNIIDDIDKLPELFHVAIKVSKMLDNVDVDVNELSETISVDQALTSQILRLCNSSHYGFSRKITSMSEAVTKLGFKTLKSLVFVAISHGVLNKDIKGYELEKGELLKNSISCAVYSKYLSEKLNVLDPETAFTAGLLRDIGKLVIQEYIGTEYNNICNLVVKEGITFSEAEEKIIGINHSQIGYKLAKKWNFPPLLMDAIKYHHKPSLAIDFDLENKQMVSIIHLADAITTMLGMGIGSDGMMYSLDPFVLNVLKLDKKVGVMDSLIAEAFDLSSEIDSMLQMGNS